MTAIPYLWFDVFTREPFAGNQLCVFPDADALPLSLMQRLARELNHSETTFLQRSERAGADSRIRILIPTLSGAAEVPFAGHPILGSACGLALARERPSVVTFATGVGEVPVAVTPLAAGLWEARMAQPLPQLVRTLAAGQELAPALGLPPGAIRRDLPIEAVDNGMQTVLIPLTDRAALDQAAPDLAALRALLGREGLCTLLFASGGREPDTDVACRVFSPFDLVPEDPATGSANGPLGEYLVRHGVLPGPVVRSEQGDSLGRPSRLTIEIVRSGGATRAVYVKGEVRLVGKGAFEL